MNRQTFFGGVLSVLMCSVVSQQVFAVDVSPVALIKQMTDTVIGFVQKIGRGLSREEAADYIYTDVESVVDFDYVAGQLLGSRKWKQLNTTERECFVDRIRGDMLALFVKAAEVYKDGQYQYRGGRRHGDRATVFVHVVLDEENHISTTFRYTLRQDGDQWKIQSVNVAHIDVLQGFKQAKGQLIKAHYDHVTHSGC